MNGPFIWTRKDEWTIHPTRPDEWASSSFGLTLGCLMNGTFIRQVFAVLGSHVRLGPGQHVQGVGEHRTDVPEHGRADGAVDDAVVER